MEALTSIYAGSFKSTERAMKYYCALEKNVNEEVLKHEGLNSKLGIRDSPGMAFTGRSASWGVVFVYVQLVPRVVHYLDVFCQFSKTMGIGAVSLL